MLDNIRRKLSLSNVKVFYNKAYDLGRFEDLIYHKGVGSALSYKRCTQEKSTKSFRYIYETSKTVKLKDVEIKMIACPAGTFQMGHEDQRDNKPRPEIIERPFLLGETEITQELYRVVMKKNPSTFRHNRKPVETVSWYAAIVFCNRLSKLQGLDECYILTDISTIGEYGADQRRIMSAKVTCDFNKNGYRLPTEKEWEYAAKAGTNNKYAGTNEDADIGDYAVYEILFDEYERKNTAFVKSKKPNEWGFYDMSGNVEEWCWDLYDPKDPKISDGRVTRGGSWCSPASRLISAYRYKYSPNQLEDYVGFRVCRSLVE